MILIYHYYLSANSSQGYVDWSAQRAKQLHKTCRTIGYPATVLRAIAGAAMTLAGEKGLRLDVIHRPVDGNICGLILPERKRGLFDTPLWLDRSRHVSCLYADERRDQIQQLLETVYADYAMAKQIHDKWERVYIAETDFSKMDAIAERLAKQIANGKTAEHQGQRTDAFFGAASPEGAVDYIGCLTIDLQKRYFLKGRPGTGKSTFLKKLVEAALHAGYNAEVYHCSFDPGSLDMLIVRERGLCVFDSTAPHEYFPTRAGDEIIDLYAEAVHRGTDERHVAQLSKIASRYKQLTGNAVYNLGLVRDIVAEIDAETQAKLDDKRVALIVEQLVNELFEET